MDNAGLVRAVVAAALLFPVAAAATEAERRTLQTEKEWTRYVVNADGSYVQHQDVAIKVLKDTGLDAVKDYSISYSTSIQTAEVDSAYTLKADGRRIDVPKGNFQVVTRKGQDGDSPVYSDQSTLTVVFPDLAVGDTTVLSYRLVATKPMFQGRFSVIESFSPAMYYGDVKVTIDAPESMQAQFQSWQMKESKPTVANGRRVVEWRWSNRTPVEPETLRDSVFNVERFPGYAFSNFPDYASIAQAYGVEAAPKAVPTARVRALAEEVARDAQGERQVAKALYDWVSTNITYAGNCIGLGAVVPRDLDVVLDNRMGDCKDHATLLQAMLTAKGIASTQALINAGGTYTLPKVPVASMVNHVINYLPGLDLYLDSTAQKVPFGTLPEAAAGKPVLLVDGHRDGLATPKLPEGKEWHRMQTRVAIAEDGSAKGSLRLQMGGRLALASRTQFQQMAPSDAAKTVKRYFQSMGFKADGTLRYDDPKELLEEFSLDATFDAQKLMPVPGGMPLRPWFVSFAPIAGLVAGSVGDEDQPPGESTCGGIRSEEEYEFEFPAGMAIAAIPADFSLENASVSYRATYRREGNRVLAKRVLDDRTPGPVCSPAYNREFAAFMRKVQPDLAAQIVYLRKGTD